MAIGLEFLIVKFDLMKPPLNPAAAGFLPLLKKGGELFNCLLQKYQ